MNSRWCRPRARQIRASKRAWRWYAHKLQKQSSMTENNREDKRSSCIHPSIRAWSLGSQAFSNSPSTCAATFGRNGVLGGMSSPKLVENTQQQETKSNFQNLWRLIRGNFSHRGHTAHCSTVFFCLIEIDWILVGANWSDMTGDPEPFAAYDVLADYKNLPGRQSATLSEFTSDGGARPSRKDREASDLRGNEALWLCGYRFQRDRLNLSVEEAISQYRSTIPKNIKVLAWNPEIPQYSMSENYIKIMPFCLPWIVLHRGLFDKVHFACGSHGFIMIYKVLHPFYLLSFNTSYQNAKSKSQLWKLWHGQGSVGKHPSQHFALDQCIYGKCS